MDYSEMALAGWQLLPHCICLAEQDFACTLLFHLPPIQEWKALDTLQLQSVSDHIFTAEMLLEWTQALLQYKICIMQWKIGNNNHFANGQLPGICSWGHLAQRGSCTSFFEKVVGRCMDTSPLQLKWQGGDARWWLEEWFVHSLAWKHFISLCNPIVWIEIAISKTQLSYKSLFPDSTYTFIFHQNY